MRQFFIVIVFILCSFYCGAQTINPSFYKELIFTRTHYTVYELSTVIAAQSGLSVSFNTQKVNPNKQVRIPTSQATVARLMEILQRKTGIRYTLGKAHILLLPPHKKPWFVLGKRNVASHNKKSTPKNAPLVSRLVESTDNRVETVNADDMLTVQPAVAGNSGGGGASGGGGGSNGGEKWIDPYQSLNKDNGLRRYNGKIEWAEDFMDEHAYGSVSIGATESFYGNPTLSAGLDFLHVSAAYYFHPKYSHFRYGIGSALRISDHWQMNLSVSAGTKFFGDASVPYKDTVRQVDTTLPPLVIDRNQPIKLSSNLTRITVSVGYKINNRFQVSAGLHLNSMRTQYYINDRSFVPATLKGVLPNSGEDFKTLKMPFYLSDSFNMRESEDRKIWIGLNLSVIYRLF